MEARWSLDIAQGDWWTHSLTRNHEGLGFMIPNGFKAMARIFHPVVGDDDTQTSWAEVAVSNGRVVHAQMQFHAIATPVDDTPDWRAHRRDSPWEGELPGPQTRALADILAEFSDPDHCWFGVWDGYGHVGGGYSVTTRHRTDAPRVVQAAQRVLNRRKIKHKGRAPKPIQDGGRISAPSRDYLLIEGSVADITRVADLVGHHPEGPSHPQSPNMWWPSDRSWFVASEIDFAWTYVCGSAELIAAVLASPQLEALPADRSHQADFKADTVNT